jgi:putative flavoprotein involved in K+ transport
MTEITAGRPLDASSPPTAITRWLADFETALTTGDLDAAAALFVDDCFWRDLLAFTWNLVTVERTAEVRRMLGQTLDRVGPRGFSVADDFGAAGSDDEGWIKFETRAGRGVGHLRLRGGKAWTLLTTLNELKGHEERVGRRRPMGVEHGAIRDRQTWLEARRRETRDLGHVSRPYVVIVGGGQGGIALGARLRVLGVPAIILDRNPRPGDSWRRRYKTLTLHDPVWYDHLPYIQFPPSWPVYSPKDKLADWLEMYAGIMELDYWGSTECKRATYDEQAGEWTVVVERDSREMTLRPKHLVLATGVSGRPSVPDLAGMDAFRGEQHHSSKHLGPDAYRGQRAVVIGSNNSAHDICAALWEVGADVTMVQRSSTLVARADSLAALGGRSLYTESAAAAGVSTYQADLTSASIPYRILPTSETAACDALRERDADFYARLERAGFMLDFGEDGSGLLMKYLRRGSGYYIDVGASDLVASGDIKLEAGVEVVRLEERAVVLSNGRTLPADLVVYATGFGSMTETVAELISPEVAAKVGRCWGLGSNTTRDPGPWEGELRNMWKPTRQEALWFHGGNLHLSRHYSLYLALQLKARMEQIPTPVYGLQEVHHRS